MASLTEAILYDGGLRTVPLFTGLTMLPVTDEVAARLDQTATGS